MSMAATTNLGSVRLFLLPHNVARKITASNHKLTKKKQQLVSYAEEVTSMTDIL
jgi:hypothetical protein